MQLSITRTSTTFIEAHTRLFLQEYSYYSAYNLDTIVLVNEEEGVDVDKESTSISSFCEELVV